MAAIKSRDTKPEMLVRKRLHAAGYRYRLHGADLPGKPDIVFRSRRKAIFVHGCFWHGHDCARGSRKPKTNVDYWTAKIARNRARDASVQSEFTVMGWRWLVVWECETKNADELLYKLETFLWA